MKHLLSSIIIFCCLSLYAQTPVRISNTIHSKLTIDTIPHPKLTLDDVLYCVAFPKESNVYKYLTGLVHLWYARALEENCTKEEAAEVTLLNLGHKINEIAKWKWGNN